MVESWLKTTSPSLRAINEQRVRTRVGRGVKILQIHNSYRQRGGEDTVVQTEADLLRAAGHELIQYRTTNPPGIIGAGGALAISAWNPWTAREVGRVAQRAKPQVAHVHNTWYRLSPAVLGALRARGIPIVVTIHNYRLVCANASLYRNGAACTDCVGTHPWRGVAHRCYRNSIAASMAASSAIAINRRLGTWVKQVDRFVVATKFLEDMLVRTGLPAERMRRIPLSAPDPGERQQPPSSSRTVLLVGRLDPEKGAREFLDIWRSSGSDLELVVIGDGVERAALEEMAVPNVRFLGWMDPADVRQQMLAARALVFPSRLMETFGLGIVESFAAGMPAIANDMGTRPDVMGRDGAGWLVSSRKEWHAALTAVADDAAVDTAGAVARDRYLTSFRPQVTLPQLESVYRELDTTSVPAGG